MFQKFQIWYQGLRNFCLCKYHRYKHTLTYPSFILPKSRYKQKIDIHSLIEKQSIIIVRRSDKNLENTFNEFENLLEDAIEPTDLVNMSMNLLGGRFKPSYIKFKPKMSTKATKSWKGDIVLLSEFLNDYDELSIYTPIYFRVSDLQNKEFPARRDKNKDSENMVKKLGCKIPIENDQFVFLHKSLIEHTPLNLNYWHVELRIYDYKEPPTLLVKPNDLNKNALEYMLKHIITFYAFPNHGNIDVIPKRYYA